MSVCRSRANRYSNLTGWSLGLHTTVLSQALACQHGDTGYHPPRPAKQSKRFMSNCRTHAESKESGRRATEVHRHADGSGAVIARHSPLRSLRARRLSARLLARHWRTREVVTSLLVCLPPRLSATWSPATAYTTPLTISLPRGLLTEGWELFRWVSGADGGGRRCLKTRCAFMLMCSVLAEEHRKPHRERQGLTIPSGHRDTVTARRGAFVVSGAALTLASDFALSISERSSNCVLEGVQRGEARGCRAGGGGSGAGVRDSGGGDIDGYCTRGRESHANECKQWSCASLGIPVFTPRSACDASSAHYATPGFSRYRSLPSPNIASSYL